MKWNLIKLIYTLWLFGTTFFVVFAHLGNPYTILGVARKATREEIRQAYKQLVKEWHPDKTKLVGAEERFVEIKQAYELLSDPDRRILYDNKGITEDDFYKRPEKPSFFTNFDDTTLFGAQQGAHFNYQENDITFFHKLSITTRQFDRIILPKSEKTPYLIFFYADWCFSCLLSAPYCRKLNDNLEPLGIQFITVHTGREPNLTRRLNIPALPGLVFLLDGNYYVYKEGITNIPKIIDFIKSKFPYKLISKVRQENLEEFLDGWTDNRVRGLILPHKTNIRLRYLVAAFYFRHRVAFGIAESTDIHSIYQAPQEKDTILLFNENISFPMASITMQDIPTSTLINILTSNQYLALPRLSSQRILDELCPCGWNKPKMKICVTLVIRDDSAEYDQHRASFMKYAQKFSTHSEKVRFSYIYHKRQSLFINALKPDGEPLLSVLMFWRRDSSRVKYDWAPVKWEMNLMNNSHEKLAETILKLLKSTENFPFEAYVTDLFDEHAAGLLRKSFTRLMHFLQSLYESLGKEQILPVFSLIGSILFIMAVGYLMVYLGENEEKNLKKQRKNEENDNNNAKSAYQPELKLHELRSEKYNGLIRLLKPGCRTILLICDMKSRQQLIPPFHKALWPYRKNKTLYFAFMYIERGLNWYKELLQLSLFEERDLKINPRNCVGTVLALNGHRKYFCVFHAKHTENKKKKVKLGGPKPERDCESGAFIGFQNSDDESDDNSNNDNYEDNNIILEGNLLNGLPNWLDRLFEGTTRRYHVNYWPEFPIK